MRDSQYHAIIAAVDVACAKALHAHVTAQTAPVFWQAMDVLGPRESGGIFVSVGCRSQTRISVLHRVVSALGLQQPVLVTDRPSPNETVWHELGSVVDIREKPLPEIIVAIEKIFSPVIVLDM